MNFNNVVIKNKRIFSSLQSRIAMLEPGRLAGSYAEAVGLKRNLKEKCSKRMTTTGTTSKKHNPSVVNPIA